MAMTVVILHPAVEFSGEKLPSREEVERLHHEAHDACFIANSVKTEVRCEPVIPSGSRGLRFEPQLAASCESRIPTSP